MRSLFVAPTLLLALNVALLLSGPRADDGSSKGVAAPGATNGSGDKPLRVGLVLDVGGRGDKSFNDSGYLGAERARRELGIEFEMIEPGDGSDRESGIRLFAAKGFDLVIGVGFIFSDDIYDVAQEYPNVHFACVDYSKYGPNGLVAPPANMVGLRFREEQGSFLVGALAGLTSRTGVLGFIGGMDMPTINKFEAGFAAGVRAVCPTCRMLSGYAGTTGEAFRNPSKGKELALAQYGAGADIIFHASGATGLGVFEAARVTSHLAVGVDSDQWDEAPGYVLTSMVKQVQVAVFNAIKGVQEGHFIPGMQELGLESGGVDYVYDERNRALIPAGARERVEALRSEVIAGRIQVPAAVVR